MTGEPLTRDQMIANVRTQLGDGTCWDEARWVVHDAIRAHRVPVYIDAAGQAMIRQHAAKWAADKAARESEQ